MFLTYQYGLRPTRLQHCRLEAILEGQRLLSNAALDEQSQAWRKSHKSVTRIEQTKSLTTIRADDPQGLRCTAGYSIALVAEESRRSLSGLLPSHHRQEWQSVWQSLWQSRLPALQIEASLALVRLLRIFRDPIDRRSSRLQGHARAALSSSAPAASGPCLDPLLHAHQARPRLARRAPDRGGGPAHGPPRSQQPGRDRLGRGKACDAVDGRNDREPKGSAPRRPQTLGKPNASSREPDQDRAVGKKPWRIWRGGVTSSPTVATPICIN